ncbi:hypothetical protein GCM10023091_19670 [Ravibacter arvi]|uniref:Uncharacterized protein n=1 Tax=Ravibacter arvi TaxID=2051041 RepID=A0ABP8LYF6_9BACT
MPHNVSYPNYVGQIFLTSDVGKGCAEIDVQHIPIVCHQGGDRLYSGLFGFFNPVSVLANVDYFYLVCADQVNDVVFCTEANGASRMVEN